MPFSLPPWICSFWWNSQCNQNSINFLVHPIPNYGVTSMRFEAPTHIWSRAKGLRWHEFPQEMFTLENCASYAFSCHRETSRTSCSMLSVWKKKKRRVIIYLTDLVKGASWQVPQIVFDPHLEVCLGKPKFSFKESRPVPSSRWLSLGAMEGHFRRWHACPYRQLIMHAKALRMFYYLKIRYLLLLRPRLSYIFYKTTFAQSHQNILSHYAKTCLSNTCMFLTPSLIINAPTLKNRNTTKNVIVHSCLFVPLCFLFGIL